MRIFVENFSGFENDGIAVEGVAHTFFDCSDRPMPTIIAGRTIQYFLKEGKEVSAVDKPAYRVPSMAEIAATSWNGFRVISTFAGCGGSSTGYRMAGFKIALANEFVPSAQASYAANKAEETVLDGRDIKVVDADSILRATGLARGELDVLDGSPPCQAFSTAGKRAKGWGDRKRYEHGASQKNEELFFDYIRLVEGLMPKVFVAENVSGLVKGVAKGFFLEILSALRACGYRVEAKLLDAQWLGVPQMRQRLIFIGVRDDLRLAPVFPKPLPYRYSVRDALPWITACEEMAGYNGHRMLSSDQPSQTILLTGPHHCEAIGRFHAERSLDEPSPTVMTHGRRKGHAELTMVVGNDAFEPRFGSIDEAAGQRRRFTIAELRRICGFPDDFVLLGTYAQQWERLGNSVPPVMMRHIAEAIRDGVLRKIERGAKDRGQPADGDGVVVDAAAAGRVRDDPRNAARSVDGLEEVDAGEVGPSGDHAAEQHDRAAGGDPGPERVPPQVADVGPGERGLVGGGPESSVMGVAQDHWKLPRRQARHASGLA